MNELKIKSLPSLATLDTLASKFKFHSMTKNQVISPTMTPFLNVCIYLVKKKRPPFSKGPVLQLSKLTDTSVVSGLEMPMSVIHNFRQASVHSFENI